MNLPVSIVLQSVALPLVLSVAGLVLARRRNLDAAVLLAAWWLAYFWMAGLPDWPPIKALDWAGLLAALSVAMTWWITGRRLLLGQALLFAVAPFVLGWPLIVHQLTVGLVVELVAMAAIGTLTVIMIFKNSARLHAPAFMAFMISAAGLAIAATLAGSLLIGELSTALASCLGGWVLYDIVRRRKNPRDESLVWFMPPVVFLFLALLVNARLYADLPLIVLGCLQIAPLIISLLPIWTE